MARLFRQPYTKPIPPDAQRVTVKGKPHARFAEDGKTVTAPLTKNGDRIRLLSAKWYGEYTDGDGITRRVPLANDKTAAGQMLADLVRKAELGKAGIVDPFEAHRKRPLLCSRCRGRGETDAGEACDCPGRPHLSEYRRFLEAEGNTPKHARQTCRRAAAILHGCKAVFLADVSPSAVIDWLATEREAGRLTIQTTNYYLRDLKSFCRWMVKDRRAADNPLSHLSGQNAAVEAHRERRHLEPDDFAAVIEAARHGKTVRRLCGPDRAMLYTLAAFTGLRESELVSLTPESFRLDADPPAVVVEAAYSKRRREDTILLRADLAALVRDWLADRPAGGKLWPGAWWMHAAEMLGKDLAAARSAWLAEAKGEERRRREATDRFAYADREGRIFDFHALRHQFISNLAAAGVHPKVAQALARHSTITLTMDRYTHLGLRDEAAALDKLPRLPSTGPRSESHTLQATGTGDSATTQGGSLPPAYRRREVRSDSVRADERGTSVEDDAGRAPQVLKLQGVDSGCGRVRVGEREKAPPGFEPGVADLQSADPETQTPDSTSTSDDATTPLTAGLTGMPASGCHPVRVSDPDLARVIAAWGTLPRTIRRAVLALIDPGE